MFLKFFKDFFLKRKLKKSLSNVKNEFSNESIRTVGILIDESYFTETENLINELVTNGIHEADITLLAYRDTVKKNEIFVNTTFSIKDISWDAEIINADVKAFMNVNFDLLINYYDVEKAALLLVSCTTKAGFKVGFSTIDKRLNHFMISTIAENYKIFTDELFRYLKILNKI
ncbi:MAG: hypothetical protein PSV16_03845 [Flavobacterium sp.]|nr:hypothetical protein [Flavobacterium sp.]